GSGRPLVSKALATPLRMPLSRPQLTVATLGKSSTRVVGAKEIVHEGHADDVGDVGSHAGRQDVRVPSPWWRRPAEYGEQREGRTHEGRAEDDAGPRLGEELPERSVPEAERRAIA